MSFSPVEVPQQKVFNGRRFPLVVTPDAAETGGSNSYEDFLAYVASHRTEIDDLLRDNKAILFRNFAADTVDKFDKFIDATNLHSMPYVGGAAVRTQITSKVFTANESPPSEKIPFHHEMAQVPFPPTHILFYCEIPAEVGGEVRTYLLSWE
jgi:hypothetical protein